MSEPAHLSRWPPKTSHLYSSKRPEIRSRQSTWYADLVIPAQYLAEARRALGVGSYADFTASKKEWLTKVTEKFPIETGGGVPLVALTALQVGNLPSTLASSDLVARLHLHLLAPEDYGVCSHRYNCMILTHPCACHTLYACLWESPHGDLFCVRAPQPGCLPSSASAWDLIHVAMLPKLQSVVKLCSGIPWAATPS